MILLSILEAGFPLTFFYFWKKWISNRFFCLHGLALIAGGFPLVMYTGKFSTMIFISGIVITLTGPFILLYPDKIRSMIDSMSLEINVDEIRRLVYIDAFIRCSLGSIYAVGGLINCGII